MLGTKYCLWFLTFFFFMDHQDFYSQCLMMFMLHRLTVVQTHVIDAIFLRMTCDLFSTYYHWAPVYTITSLEMYYTCMFECILFMCMCVWLCMREYMCVCVCVCECAHVCACVCIFLCERVLLTNPSIFMWVPLIRLPLPLL